MAKMDKSVGDILKSYKIDLDEATWDCHGTLVIYHRYLERIADKAGITFDEPREIHIDAKAKEVVLCVRGHMGDNESWSYGEVMPYNNTNPYPFAMAEKRAKDRVILKLIGLSGHVYSEEEAEDFKKGPPAPPVKSQVKAPSAPVRPPSPRGGPRPTPPPKKEAEILTVEKDLPLDERVKLLQECLTDHPAGIGRGAIQKATGFSLPQFNETISALREDGKVELRGQKRGAKWHWVADENPTALFCDTDLSHGVSEHEIETMMNKVVDSGVGYIEITNLIHELTGCSSASQAWQEGKFTVDVLIKISELA